MGRHPIRAAVALTAAACLLGLALAAAHASSLGIGTNEAVLPSAGLFGRLTNWINMHQQAFYRSLTQSLKAMRDGGNGTWTLVGLSFVYGIFHAAGPGHGKAVISSYMLANEVALRRGIMLAFVSALLQAVTAVVMMGAVFLFLRGTAISMTDATRFLEIASYAMVTLFGAWLLWKKAWPRLAGLFGLPSPAGTSEAGHVHSAACTHSQGRLGGRYAQQDALLPGASLSAAFAAAGPAVTARPVAGRYTAEVCETCGHAHIPDPALLGGDRFDWRTAWTAVAAVGLRPCSGALIVLTFAFLNRLWAGGLLSVLAMALGTAITVAALATLAVTAKGWAVAAAGTGTAGARLHAAIEIGGAALVFMLGLLLLAAGLKG